MKKKIFLILATLTAIFGVLFGVACSKNKGSSAAQSSSDSGNSESSVPAHTCVWGREIFYDENGDGTHFQKCAVEGCEEKIIHTMGAWEFDETAHWRLCSVADCKIDDRGEHLEKDGVCEACAQDVCVVDFMLEPNAGEETKPFKTSVLLCGETILYPSEEPTKTGYTFKGWMDKDGNTFLKAPTDTAYWRVEAKWKANTYAITYELNGGKNNAKNKSSYAYDTGMELQAPTRGGYDFIEWQVNGEKIESIPSGSMGELTLTAVWSEPIFTVRLGYDYVDEYGGMQYCPTAITGFTAYGKEQVRETLVIPAMIDGVTIEAIGANAFEYCKNFSSVTFASKNISIGEYAFYKSGVGGTLEFEVSSVGAYAFAQTPISELIYSGETVGDSTFYNWGHAFYNCSSLKKATVKNGSIGANQFEKCFSLEEVAAQNVGNVYDYAFFDCKKLKSFTAKTPVRLVGVSAFENCKNLTSFDFSSVREIGDSAFRHCESLNSVNFSSIVSLGERAFYGCEAIKEVRFPSSVEEIGYACFKIKNLEKVFFEDKATAVEEATLKKLGAYAFTAKEVYISDLISWCGIEFGGYVLDGSDLYVKNILVDDLGIVYDLYGGIVMTWRRLKTINAYAFAGCTSLKTVVIPSSVEKIESQAFRNCDGIERLDFSDATSLTTIEKNAFSYSDKVYSVDLSNASSLTTIDEYAFAHMDNLHWINVDGASLDVKDYAFYDCAALERIIIGDSVVSLGAYAFINCPNVYYVEFGSGLQSVNVHSFGIGGVLVNDLPNGCYLVAEVYNRSSLAVQPYYYNHGSGGYSATDIYLPSIRVCTEETERGSVQTTTDGFVYYTYDCVYEIRVDGTIEEMEEERSILINYTGDSTDVVVPSGLNIQRIGDYAFYDNDQINSVTMSQTLSVGYKAFAKCNNLKSVTLNGSWSSYPHDLFNWIKGAAFSECDNLESVTIGDGIEEIRTAFSGCAALKSIVIGKTVKVIDQDAFVNLENLTIYYKGTAEDWAKIYNSSWDYCYDKDTTERFELAEDITLYVYSAEEPQKNEDGTAYDGNYWRYEDGEIVVWELTTEA